MRTGISFSPITSAPALISVLHRSLGLRSTITPARRGSTLTSARLAELAAATVAPFVPHPRAPIRSLVGSSHTSAARFAFGIAAAIGVLSAFVLAVHR